MDGGLNMLNPSTEIVTRFLHEPGNRQSPLSNELMKIVDDGHGGLWIGTMAHGLSHFDTLSHKFTHYVHNPADPDCISNNQIRSIFLDSVGGYG
ncbi:MAG: ligand-binding sensor domain-containing protein [Lentisphaeria bacterium]|jgi:ligand-binding sensor domain-containing protein